MNPKKHLFHLVSSLTKAEKRGFSLYLKRYSPEIEGNSKVLFEGLSKLDEYDEKVFKASLPENIQKNFSYEKGKLLQTLVSFLTHFNRKYSVEVELHNLLIQVEIFIKKKQMSLAQKFINKGMALAEENDMVFFINRFQDKLMTLYDLSNFTMEERKQLYKDFEQTGAQIAKETTYQSLKKRMTLEIFFGDLIYHLREEINPEIAEIWEHDLIIHEEHADTFNSKIDLYTIKRFYYRTLGKFEEQLVYHRKSFNLIRNNKTSYIYSVVVAHFNYILNLNITNRFQEARKELLIFLSYKEKFPEKFDFLGEQIFSYMKTKALLSCSFHWYDFAGIEKIIEENNDIMEKSFSRFDFHRMEYFCYLMQYYFVINDWEKALDYLARYENEVNFNERIKNLYFSAKALGIINHFEQDSDRIVLHSQFSSLYSFSRKNGFIGKLFYKEILALTRKLSNKPSEETLKKIVQKFLEAFSKVPKHFYPGYKIFSLWAESRISDKSMLQLGKEKNKEIFPEN